MNHDQLLDLARELNAKGESYALVTVVRAVAPTSAYVGAQAIVLADGTLHGWIGGGCAKGVVVDAALGAIRNGAPKLIRISNDDQVFGDDDVEHHAMACASNGSIELFVQLYSAHEALCILGDTPAADEARFLAQRLRIRLVAAPSEAPIVLIATQGQGDEDALEAALRSPAMQVLMIASRRKADKLRGVMRMRGIGEAQLAKLHAPAGPDAGAKTPGEIALVAIVGVLGLLRGRAALAPIAAARELPAAPRPAAAPGQFVNPVCGMAVNIADAKHVEAYEGVNYYFCCDGCTTTFRADRAKYAAIHHASGEAP
jgi:xanthine dehydrogenase accessory factor